jgi:hypothetical protein
VTKTRKDDEIKIWRDEGRGRKIRREEDEIKNLEGKKDEYKEEKNVPNPNTGLKCHPQMFRP